MASLIRLSKIVVQIMAVSLFLFLYSCGSGSKSSTPDSLPETHVSKVEIEQTALLLTHVQDTKQITATAYDAQNNILNVRISWKSTNKNIIDIDENGVVVAVADNGTSQIIAEAGGIESTPLLGIVTTPTKDAILLTDAQIVGEPVEADPDAEPSFDNTYKVVLSGIAPEIGSLLINTESKPVAGRVVSINTVGGQTTATLKLVSIRELFPNLSVNETIDLSQVPISFKPEIEALYDIEHTDDTFTFTPKASAITSNLFKSTEKAAAPPPFTDCETTYPGKGFEFKVHPVFSIAISPKLNFIYTPDNGLEKFVVSTEPKIKFEGKLSIDESFEGKLACIGELGSIPLLVNGPLALLVGGKISFGPEFKAGGKLIVTKLLTLGLASETKAKAQIGISCPGGTNCEFVKSLGDTTNSNSASLEGISEDAKWQVEPSFSVSLYAKVEIGSHLFKSLRFEAFKVNAGDTLQGSFARPIDQILNKNYQSNYKVLVEAAAEAGLKLKEALKIFGVQNINVVELKISREVGKSPTGAITADKTDFLQGDTINFNVKLDPCSVVFVPPIGAYNIYKILLIQQSNGGAKEIGTAIATTGQTSFDFSYTALEMGSTKDIYGFVVTRLLPFEILALELGSASGPDEGGQIFKYTSAPLQPGAFYDGEAQPVPGPVIATVSLASPVPPGFTGQVHNYRVRLESAGVGVLDLAETELIPTPSIYFSNGRILIWSLSSGLVPTGEACTIRSPIGILSGFRSIVIATGNDFGHSGTQVNDTAFDRCNGTDAFGRSFNDTHIHGFASSSAENWADVNP